VRFVEEQKHCNEQQKTFLDFANNNKFYSTVTRMQLSLEPIGHLEVRLVLAHLGVEHLPRGLAFSEAEACNTQLQNRSVILS
jgi:hypothetical protein